MFRRPAIALVFAVVASVLVGVARPPAAHAGVTTSIGTASISDMVVDDAHAHVFISRASTSNVEVYDFHGALVQTIANQHSPLAMVLEGPTLYVVESATGSIEKIDTQSLSDTGPLVSGLTNLSRLAFAGGRLWTAEDGIPDNPSTLESVSLAGVVTRFGQYQGTDFATSPGAPDTLFLSADAMSPSTLYRLNVSGATPVVEATAPNVSALGVSPDGSRLIAPTPGYDFEELSASSLAPDGVVYPGGTYPSAVAVSPGHGGLVATGLEYGSSTPDIRVDALGNPVPIMTATTNGLSGAANIPARGLGLSADGDRLFAVSGDGSHPYALNVYRVFGQTTTTITSSLNPSLPGQPVTLTISVTPNSTATTPTGTVQLTDGDTVLGSLPLTNGTASYSTSAFPWGSHSLTAVYGGDTNYDGSSGQLAQTVNSFHATTAITTSATPVTTGQPVTFTVTVTPDPGTATPTGAVRLEDSLGGVLGSLTVGPNPMTLTTSSLKGGEHTIYATYLGDNAFTWSAANVSQAVLPFPTQTYLTSAPNPSASGQKVTFTAVIGTPASGGTPTGTVAFSDGPNVLGAAPVSNFEATFTTALVGVGSHTITAIYSGDSTFAPSQLPIGQTVAPAPDPNGTFVPVPPARILDTRTTHNPVGPSSTIDVQATGKGGVPTTGVTAVVVNLTATDPTTVSYLTAYPTGGTVPTASNLNFGPGQTVPNLVVVKLGSGGKFSIYNAQGNTDVIADVVGWYSDGSLVYGDRYASTTPARILDTRSTHSPIPPNSSINVSATGQPGLAPGDATAVVVNITATNPTAGSYLTAYPTGGAAPTASNLNFGPGQTVPNLVVVKLGPNGKFSIYNAQGNTDVIVDIVGWYTNGPSLNTAALTPVAPARILDTRTTHSPVGPSGTIDVQATGQGGVPPGGVSAVVVNITATDPTAVSYLTAYPTAAPRPTASNLNVGPGQTVPNLVVVKLGTGGKFTIYNAQGNTDVIADVVGWYGP